MLEAAGVAAELGDLQKALTMNRRALDVSLMLRTDQELIGTAHHSLGATLINLGQFDEAERHLRQAVSLLEHTKARPKQAEALLALGSVSAKLGYYDESRKSLEPAVAILRSLRDVNATALADALNQLASVRLHDDPLVAEELLREALDITERHLGSDHVLVAEHLTELSLVCQGQERLAEAEFYAERAYAILRALPEHPRRLAPLNALAGLRVAQKRFQEAAQIYEYCIALAEKHFPKEHPMVPVTMHKLSIAYLGLRRWIDADQMHRKSMARLRAFGKFDGAQLNLMKDQFHGVRGTLAHEAVKAWWGRMKHRIKPW
jgi:tetratricopeptide (TPR) repeat protein